MRVIFPQCPSCKNTQTVGRVKSFDYEKNGRITAYFCSYCLTEFDTKGSILRPIWSTNFNLKQNII